MKRIAWLTDIHLNFLRMHKFDGFFSSVVAHNPDAVFVSGDIGESSTIVYFLRLLETRFKRPTYFVLGNHDFYRGSFDTVKAAVSKMCIASQWLTWLTGGDVISLTPEVGLVGHDSWSDGRLGDYARSDLMLNDYLLIEDFAPLDKDARLLKLNALGDAAAAHFRRVLPGALAKHRHIYVVTHVPPFEDACLYEGEASSVFSLPHFSCKAVGDVLHEVMLAHPDHRMTVLCGHTHNAADVQILGNLRVIVGAAEYGRPAVQPILEIEG